MTTTYSEFPAHIIAGRQLPPSGAPDVRSIDPYSGVTNWESGSATMDLICHSIQTAEAAFVGWAATPLEDRMACAERFTEQVKNASGWLAELISREGGKPSWEAKTEVNSLITKYTASIEAFKLRCAESSRDVRGLQSRTRFKPHGVVVVLGPYNFPVSMANGHIMPALIAGNSVVFKPSELTPLAGVAMTQLWHAAGLPPGVLNCLTGDRSVGEALVGHDRIKGVFFVGSHRGGLAILKALADRPDKVVALEMGGNNPLVIHDFDSLKLNEVVGLAIQSAFVSSGQRCSGARRLLVAEPIYELFSRRLVEVSSALRIGNYSDNPEPFYGPMIRESSARRVSARFDELAAAAGKVLLAPKLNGPQNTLLSPGIINIESCKSDQDEEIFGPVLKIQRFSTLDEAINLANATKFGLSAGIVTKDRSIFNQFYDRSNSGIINWNQQLTGATTFAPFGGIKQSGNFRPAGFLSADYCSHAVASFEVAPDALSTPSVPGITF